MEFKIGQLVKYLHGGDSPYYVIGNKDGLVTILIGDNPTPDGYGLIASAGDVSMCGFDKKYIGKYFCVFGGSIYGSVNQLTLLVKKRCKICRNR